MLDAAGVSLTNVDYTLIRKLKSENPYCYFGSTYKDVFINLPWWVSIIETFANPFYNKY